MLNRTKFFPGFLLAVFVVFTAWAASAQVAPKISPEEFSRIIIAMSEESGYFSNDNWVSNETSYLTVLDKLEQHDIHGGAYIGVGPNQNFTYIANIKPDIAFIVDIRRQNMLQHLIYKIIFEKAKTRAEFFSLLLSKPLDPVNAPGENAGINSIIYYFYSTPSDADMFIDLLMEIEDTLTKKYRFPFTRNDRAVFNRILQTFFLLNLNITYNGSTYSWFPTYGELLTATDFNNKQRNPFNSREDYLYLRNMHLENRIIPITGNFGGNKALKEVANYLKSYNMTVSAFYLSNVEQYLMRDWNLWLGWVENVRSLPKSETSVFIRWTYQRGYSGNYFYYSRNGSFNQTRLQWIATFVKNFNEGRYNSYSDLILLDYIKD